MPATAKAAPAAHAPEHSENANVAQARALLRQIEQLIVRERVAVGALDAEAIMTVAREKQELAERVRGLVERTAPDGSRPTGGVEMARLRDSLRRALGEVVAQAEANVVLLSDAITTVAEVLGIRREAGTYDARARLVQEVRAASGRDA